MRKSTSGKTSSARQTHAVLRAMRCVGLYVLVAVVCYAAMALASLIPTSALTAHVKQSAQVLSQEGLYPSLLIQDQPPFLLDNFSESLIVNHTYYMDSRLTPDSVLLNAAWRHHGEGENPVTNLASAVSDGWQAPNATRSHYWMGFRAIVRPLLALTDIQGIRLLITSCFFALFLVCLILLVREVDGWFAAAFGLSIIAVYPFIVSVSLQYSCDFFLAFFGIIAVIMTYRRPAAVTFLLLGQLTQYFDFYTTPILTWAMPFFVLYALRQKRGMDSSLRAQLRLFFGTLGVWLLAYGGMWVTKMILNTCWGGVDGFAIFSRFLYYTGMDTSAGDVRYYTLGEALVRNCLQVGTVFHVLLYAAFALCAAIGARISIQRQPLATAQDASSPAGQIAIPLLCALIPLAWIALGRQAAGTHTWFQYRTLTPCIFALSYAWCLLMKRLPRAFSSRKK